MSESVGRVFVERGGIKVAYEFGVVDEFDTTVGECWWGRWKVRNFYCRKKRMVVRGKNALRGDGRV